MSDGEPPPLVFDGVPYTAGEVIFETQADDPLVFTRRLELVNVDANPKSRKPFVCNARYLVYVSRDERRYSSSPFFYGSYTVKTTLAEDDQPAFKCAGPKKVVRLTASEFNAKLRTKRARNVERLQWIRDHADGASTGDSKEVVFDHVTDVPAGRRALSDPELYDVCPLSLDRSEKRIKLELSMYHAAVGARNNAQSHAYDERTLARAKAELEAETARKMSELDKRMAKAREEREAAEARVAAAIPQLDMELYAARARLAQIPQ